MDTYLAAPKQRLEAAIWRGVYCIYIVTYLAAPKQRLEAAMWSGVPFSYSTH